MLFVSESLEAGPPACRACRRPGGRAAGAGARHDYYYLLRLLLRGQDVQRNGSLLLCGACADLTAQCASFLRVCRESHDVLSSSEQLDPVLKVEKHESETEQWSEDETPLVLLKSEGEREDLVDLALETKPEKNNRSKKRKHHRQDKPSKPVLDQSSGVQIVKSELQDVNSKHKRRRKGKVKKTKGEEVRDGASKPRKDGRRVVETEEYVVIRLTAEQVMQEMYERARTERYITAPYKCENCVKVFNYADVLHNHMEKHSPKCGPFQCELCLQYCPSAVSLRGHMKSHCTRYSCKACGCVRLSRQHLLEHHALAHAGAAPRYVCGHCGLTTVKRTLFQKHMRVHFPRPSLACDQCGNTYKTLETLRAHLLRRHSSGQSCHRCPQCGRTYADALLLRAHRLTHAAAPADHYCVECDVRFKSRGNLNMHLRKSVAHRVAGAARHACASCPKRFWTQGSLTSHVTWAHEGRREHACADCARAYGTRDGLRVHMRTAHGAGPQHSAPRHHVCDYCTKAFKARGVLIKHIRVHTGERPYACDECGHKFAQSGTLATHVRLVHRKLPRRAQERPASATGSAASATGSAASATGSAAPAPLTRAPSFTAAAPGATLCT